MLGAPAQKVLGSARIGDGDGRITSTPRSVDDGNVRPGYLAHHIEHLAVGVPRAGTQVQHEFAMTSERLDRQDVCIGEVEYVYVVANARAIRRRVVIAVEVEMISSAQGDVEGKRYEVNLRDRAVRDAPVSPPRR